MPSVIISSISESAGKTALAAALIARLRDEGVEVRSTIGELSLFASDDRVQHVAANDVEPTSGGIVVIEGSSGDADLDVDLANRLDSNIVLVATLDEDIEAAAEGYGERLAGVLINKVPPYRDVHAARAVERLADAGVNCFGWVPEDRRLAANTVDALRDHIEGTYAFEVEDASGLVDNYLIGGLVLDWGPFYFRSQDNSCVVVRTGRPDVQIAALQSETTRAMVLTGGGKPIDYVFYEARSKRIPLIVVEGDTEATMQRIDALAKSEFDHPDKLGRMSELLADREVFEQLLDLVAQPSTR